MNIKTNLIYLPILLVVVAFLSGCTQQVKNPMAVNNVSDEYFLELVETNPLSPAVLALGQKLNIIVAYEIPSGHHVQIWARPFTNGRRTAGYSAHHLMPVNGAEQPQGMVEMWFFFEAAAVVDEVRIFIKPVNSDDIIKTVSYPLDARWQ